MSGPPFDWKARIFGEMSRDDKKMEQSLLEELRKYAASDMYPLHMPGHKRKMKFFGDSFDIDITEIEGFDNLHHAEGLLLHAQQRAARLYGAEETFFLINGSTCGILAAVAAAKSVGARMLFARNCHKAAYHAAFLNGIQVEWMYPSLDWKRGMYGAISPELVKRSLKSAGEKGAVAAVLITSPTYDGVVSDVRAIAELVHEAGAILIVDEAHGAHFAMHPYFPESAVSCGADLVINSLHKTMPALTQTALLHVQGERVDRKRLRKYLDMYQSSSPSYVLMAGMDACVRRMEAQRSELFDVFAERLERLRTALKELKLLRLVTGEEKELEAYAYDRSKVLIEIAESSGKKEHGLKIGEKPETGMELHGNRLAQMLREDYHLEVEMASEHYVTAILTVADTPEGFERLETALLELDAKLQAEWEREPEDDDPAMSERGSEKIRMPVTVMTMAEADLLPKVPVSVLDCAGWVSAEFVYLYPPGIPFVIPGEEIPDGFAELLLRYRNQGLKIQGLEDYTGRTILCIDRLEG